MRTCITSPVVCQAYSASFKCMGMILHLQQAWRICTLNPAAAYPQCREVKGVAQGGY